MSTSPLVSCVSLSCPESPHACDSLNLSDLAVVQQYYTEPITEWITAIGWLDEMEADRVGKQIVDDTWTDEVEAMFQQTCREWYATLDTFVESVSTSNVSDGVVKFAHTGEIERYIPSKGYSAKEDAQLVSTPPRSTVQLNGVWVSCPTPNPAPLPLSVQSVNIPTPDPSPSERLVKGRTLGRGKGKVRKPRQRAISARVLVAPYPA
jgi:hypothetical protein